MARAKRDRKRWREIRNPRTAPAVADTAATGTAANPRISPPTKQSGGRGTNISEPTRNAATRTPALASGASCSVRMNAISFETTIDTPESDASPLDASPLGPDLFRKRVAQTDGPIEHRPRRRRILVRGEIALPLELHWLGRIGRGDGGLDAGVGEDFERFRIEIRGKIAGVGRRIDEQLVVQPDLGRDRVRGRHPVHGCLHLAAIGGIAALGGRVIGAAQFDDLAGGVLDHLAAGDE